MLVGELFMKSPKKSQVGTSIEVEISRYLAAKLSRFYVVSTDEVIVVTRSFFQDYTTVNNLIFNSPSDFCTRRVFLSNRDGLNDLCVKLNGVACRFVDNQSFSLQTLIL